MRQQPQALIPPNVGEARSPLREISEPPQPGPSHTSHDDDEQQPRRRKIPVRTRSPTRSPSPSVRSRPARSGYFSKDGSSSIRAEKGKEKAGDLARELIFSPHRQAPLVLRETGDELEELDALKQKGKEKEPTSMGEVHWEPGIEPGDPGDTSSDYGFDVDLPDEVFAELEKVEEEHFQQTQTQTQARISGPSQTRERSNSLTFVATGRTAATSSQATLVSGRHLSESRGSGSSQAQSQRPDAAHISYIEISDDDEKENIAVPTRHMRRRVEPSEDDVIVLSD